VSPEYREQHDSESYRPLGLLGNPFRLPSEAPQFDGREYEMLAESNRLLGELVRATGQDKAKPIVVSKTDAAPPAYSLRAVGHAEHAMANDESINILHAYVPMFMMRMGRVRATLQTLAERLAFREFDKTLARYVECVLAEPDEDLIAYQVLGAERLAEFTESFRADPLAHIDAVFGDPTVIERRPELTEVGDLRRANLDANVDEEESMPEIDASIADAPGTEVILEEEADARGHEDIGQEVADYIIEYTKVHVSPVVSRALRVYRERGLAALANEFTITKAPKKTLAAVAKLARCRFDKVVLIFDGFDSWITTPAETRSQIRETLSDIRWTLEDDAVMVLALEQGHVAELEEQFASGTQIVWDFPGVMPLQDAPDALDSTIVNRWLSGAAYPGAEPITMGDRVLAALAEDAEGSLGRFVPMAAAAIESAAARGVSSLDDEALSAGRAAKRSKEIAQ
jgi:hypothetical protein